MYNNATFVTKEQLKFLKEMDKWRWLENFEYLEKKIDKNAI